jgi:DNA-binding IclR family transcriptional regulator
MPEDAPGSAMSNDDVPPTTPGGVQSVDRAITVLELLARTGEAGVTDLAAEIGVHKSTIFRLLGALESRGLVEQTRDRGKYRLGMGLLRLAGAVTGQMDLTHQSGEICERLAAEVGETVNLAILQEHFAVNVDQALGPATLTTQNWVGRLTPLHATSSGKLLLAHVGPDHRQALIRAAGGLERFTEHTLTSVQRLEKELAGVLEQGFAMACEEYEVGLNALAAPVRGADGQVVAALSTSGPTYRFDQARMKLILPALSVAADEISGRLGYLTGR